MNADNDKIFSNEHKTLVVIGILLVSLIVVGGTFAYILFIENVNVSNKNIASSTTCFNVLYSAHNDTSPITGTLIPSSGPVSDSSKGLSGKISIGIDKNCDIGGLGKLYLNITNGSSVLFQTVNPHCENSQTLKTMVGYTNQTSCEEQDNGVWVTNGTALKYAVYDTNSDISSLTPLSVGYISSVGEKVIYNNFEIKNPYKNLSEGATPVDTIEDYFVYIWLDGNLSDNSYANQSIVGNISASVLQNSGLNSDKYTVDFDAAGGNIENVTFTELEPILFTTVGSFEYIIPQDGVYKIEAWGAQGGGTSDYRGGYGSYSVGNITLSAGTNLYINVGGSGTANLKNGALAYIEGGYNGGGSGTYGGDGDSYSATGGSGGGATHIATASGTLSTLSSDKDSILIVAGGGGGAGVDSYSSFIYSYAGGNAGGYQGNVVSGQSTTCSAGTQVSGHLFGIGGNYANATHGAAGGGGGYYGGGGGDTNAPGCGGSGYIGNNLLTNKAMYCYNCTTSEEESTLTYTTTNVSETPTANYAKMGDGAARIMPVVNGKEVGYGDTYGELPVPTREGYVFGGWNTKKDGRGVTITSSSVYNLKGNQTLYAIWYKFTIDSVTGGSITSISASDDTFTLTPTPSDGYVYAGATISCDGEDFMSLDYNETLSFNMPDGDVVITPIFIPLVVTTGGKQLELYNGTYANAADFLNMSYEITYNPMLKTSTIVLTTNSIRLHSTNVNTSQFNATLNAKATDSNNTATSTISFSSYYKHDYAGYSLYYTGFSPKTIVVQHSDTDAQKTVNIAVSMTARTTYTATYTGAWDVPVYTP